MRVLAIELIALVLVFAADDAIRGRPPTATWSTSLRVVGAAFVAVVAVTIVEAAIDGNVL